MEKIIFRYDIHKAMWNVLADNPKWGKRNAIARIQHQFPGVDIGAMMHCCPACQAAYEALCDIEENPVFIDRYDMRCDYCPLEWGKHGKCCGYTDDDETIYQTWYSSVDIEEDGVASRSARIIANLPLSEENSDLYTVVE